MTVELSICLIAKDEEQNLDAALTSVRDCADEIVVVDTGSTDATTAVAERHGARVGLFTPETNPEAFFRDDEATCGAFGAPAPYTGEIMLGDFGAARRKSFSMARGEFIYWMDSDDVVEGADKLRQVVADMRARNLDLGFLAYDYARDDKGRTFYRQWRERVVRAGAAVWVNPVHEVLMPTRFVQSWRYEGITNIHRRKADRKTVPNRNYKILLRQLAADRANGAVVDPRTLFYLGQEARWVEPHKSAEFYEDYLKRSGWCEERAAAHVALGSMLEFGQLGGAPEDSYNRANREYATAAMEMPDNPDGLFGLARIAYLRGRHPDCVAYTERAMKIGNTDSMLGANPLDRTYRPHIYLNHALALMGRLEEAIASCKAGLAACPDDPGVAGGAPGMLKYNLASYEAELARRSAPTCAVEADGGVHQVRGPRRAAGAAEPRRLRHLRHAAVEAVGARRQEQRASAQVPRRDAEVHPQRRYRQPNGVGDGQTRRTR
jgi:glycosyltransferase involved in cell wall biosynthesis